jgi:hypothetical protein
MLVSRPSIGSRRSLRSCKPSVDIAAQPRIDSCLVDLPLLKFAFPCLLSEAHAILSWFGGAADSRSIATNS